MKRVCVLLLLPDFQKEQDIISWESAVEYATSVYDEYPYKLHPNVDCIKRWAIGFLSWKKLINCISNDHVTVYFFRTDFRLNEGDTTIDNNTISIGFQKKHGHIIYKTLKSFALLQDRFDFFVRGNINCLIDTNTLLDYIQTIPSTETFSSPIWEGNSYPFGYFMLFSSDICKYLSQIDLLDTNRWFTEPTSDDYEITKALLKRYKYYVMDGCQAPLHNIAYSDQPMVNKHMIRFVNEKEPYTNVQEAIKNSKKSVFVYRYKFSLDGGYIPVYKEIIKKIWDKQVQKFIQIELFNQSGHHVPHLMYERDEQLLAGKYIKENDVVLELGARYGSVSCTINKILSCKTNQLSVEPDNAVWDALEKNKIANNCNFNIFKGIVTESDFSLVSNCYGTYVVPGSNDKLCDHKSLKQLQDELSLTFNVLVADCEGFLEIFLNENKFLYSQLDLIIFECDRGDVCNYKYIKSELINNQFTCVVNGFHCVYMKQNVRGESYNYITSSIKNEMEVSNTKPVKKFLWNRR